MSKGSKRRPELVPGSYAKNYPFKAETTDETPCEDENCEHPFNAHDDDGQCMAILYINYPDEKYCECQGWTRLT